jgi:hypothetical protein
MFIEMARLVATGLDNGTRDLDSLDTVDLKAIRLAQEWGADQSGVIANGHKKHGWTFSPCPRPHCGGAIVDGWGITGCILCCRSRD